MKRRLLLCSTVVPAMLASGAMGQIVNFCDSHTGNVVTPAPNFNIGNYYYELFAGQGAYPDPGNNVWNGYFGRNVGQVYGSTYVYSGTVGSGVWPIPAGNPGNPYAAYLNPGSPYANAAGWVSSFGANLFEFSGGPAADGCATSGAVWTPITLTCGGYTGDALSPPALIQNGTPAFLLSTAAESTVSNIVFTMSKVPAGTYGLFVYGASPTASHGTTFAVNSGTAHNGIASTVNVGGGSTAQSFVEGQNFVVFENVTPDSGSNITITASPNVGGTADVNGFQLIFNPAPTVLTHTAAQNVYAGGTASFSVTTCFAPSPAYQWQSIIGGVTNTLADGGNISGSQTAHLTIANVAAGNVGLYQCIVTANAKVGASPVASLSILTSTAATPLQAGDPVTSPGLILQPGDRLTDLYDNILGANQAYMSVPPPFNMGPANIEDNNLTQYLNYGTNGSVGAPPFVGPAGFVVTPKAGSTVANGIRIFTSSSHSEDDPADYRLEGSNDGGATFTPIAGGHLSLPAARNAASGPIDISGDALQEITFANATAYTTYRVTFTNVNNNATASNGVQIAELQLLGTLNSTTPGINAQPAPSRMFYAGETAQFGVIPSGAGPLTYQWFFNSTTPVPGGTSAILTIPSVQPTNAGSYACTVSNPYGSNTTTAAAITVLTNPPSVVTFNTNGTGWTLIQGVPAGSTWGGDPNTPNITSNVLLLLDDMANNESSDNWFNNRQCVDGFIMSFTYQVSTPVNPGATPADGMCFVLQNNTYANTNVTGGGAGLATEGNWASGLGYGQIRNSFALELDTWPPDANGPGYIFGTDGNVPASDASLGSFIHTDPVPLTNAHPIFIQLYYSQGNANLVLRDTVSGQSFVTNTTAPNTTSIYNDPLTPAADRFAYVGLVAGCGGANAQFTASNFVYSSTSPPILSINSAGGGNVNVTWPLAVATLFQLEKAVALNGPWTKVGTAPSINAQYRNQVTDAAGAGSSYYRLSLY